MKEKILSIIEPKNTAGAQKTLYSNQKLFNIIVPLLLEQFLTLMVGVIDTFMVSCVNEVAVASISLINQLNNMFIMVFIAVANGGNVVLSQYIGSGNKKDVVHTANQLLSISLLLSAMCLIVMIIFKETAFSYIFPNVSLDIQEVSLLYLSIMVFSFPFIAIYSVCSAVFRSIGNTKSIMKISLIMNICNILGNSIAIFYLHIGAFGIAISSVVSWAIAAVIMLVALQQKKYPVYFDLNRIYSVNIVIIKQIFSIAIPGSIENGLFQLTKIGLSAIVALFGTQQIAANGIAQSFWSLAAVLCLSMGPVFSTVIGQCMGANDIISASYYMRKLLRITYLGTVAWNILTLAVIPILLPFYNISEETFCFVVYLIVIHNIFCGAFCPVGLAFSNALRAAGDAKYTMYISLFSSVFCRISLTFLLGVILDLQIIGVAIAMVIDWGIKAGLVYKRYLSGHWKYCRVI